MNISKLDIFSSPFQFDFGNQVTRKGTIQGAILSNFLVITILIYSGYLFYLYFGNQINPNYASQSFVSDDLVDVELSEEVVGFRYEYGVNLLLDDLEAQKNQTYLSFAPYFYYQKESAFQLIPLSITKCKSPQLKGYNCFDFSTVKNYTLALSNSQNIISNLYLFIYKCQDTDMFKPQVPNNCVEDAVQFNSVINNPFAHLHLKLYSSQFNTTSQQIQVSHRNFYAFLQGNQFLYYAYKTQKQITNIKQGAIIQTDNTFSSPISYEQQTISFDRESMFKATNQTAYMQIALQMDEIVQHIQIQYTSFSQILSQCNSVLALLMCIGFLGRKYSLKLMRKDIFILLLQNMFHGTYEAILRKNNFLDQKQIHCEQYFISQTSEKAEEKENDQQIEENNMQTSPIAIPPFLTKSIKSVESQNHTPQNQEQERHEVIELFSPKNSQEKMNILNYNKQQQLRRGQRQIKLSNSPLFKKNSLEIQITNSNNTQINQETSQESQLLGQSKFSFFKKDQINNKVNQFNQVGDSTNFKSAQKYYLKITKVIKNNSILKDIHQKLFKLKQSDYQQSQGLDSQDKKVIESHIYECFDVLQIYRDLILLKKAVMMLVSKEQLAALQLIGLSSDFLKSEINCDSSGQIKSKKNNRQMSYFEQQYSILKSNDLQEEHINLFFEKIHNGQGITEVDQRILNSLQS